jgi:hypothetical protein
MLKQQKDQQPASDSQCEHEGGQIREEKCGNGWLGPGLNSGSATRPGRRFASTKPMLKSLGPPVKSTRSLVVEVSDE